MFVGFLPQRPVNLGIDASEFLFQVLQEPVHGQVQVLVSLIVVVHAALPRSGFPLPALHHSSLASIASSHFLPARRFSG